MQQAILRQFHHYQLGTWQEEVKLAHALCFYQDWRKAIDEVLSTTTRDKLLSVLAPEQIAIVDLLYAQHHINVVTILDDTYPSTLLRCHQMPIVLYYQGDLQLLNKHCIGLLSEAQLAGATKNIVSRCLVTAQTTDSVCMVLFKKGVGIYLCEKAVQQKCAIVAIAQTHLACYALLQYKFLQRALKHVGLILSSYPLQTRARYVMAHYQLFAQLTQSLAVVHASRDSEQLALINQIINQNKPVYVMPGDLADKQCRGSNQLLYEGATIWCYAQDVIAHVMKT